MKITYLPHARERMELRGISEEDVEETLRHPDLTYPGKRDRTVAERVPPGRRLALRVVYNQGLEDERIVVTVELGRPTNPASLEGGET